MNIYYVIKYKGYNIGVHLFACLLFKTHVFLYEQAYNPRTRGRTSNKGAKRRRDQEKSGEANIP